MSRRLDAANRLMSNIARSAALAEDTSPTGQWFVLEVQLAEGVSGGCQVRFHGVGEMVTVLKLRTNVLQFLRCVLESPKVIGLHELLDALHVPGEFIESPLRPVETGAGQHGRQGKEGHHGRDDRHQSSTGGNEGRVGNDSGWTHDRGPDSAADGH